jgi:hypothetical protein
MFNLNDPFFRPLWLRIMLVLVTGGWALFELLSGSPGWALLFGAAAVYAGYGFFVAFDPDQGRTADKEAD